MALFGLDENHKIDGTTTYTYGIDPSGKMYIYNKGAQKMVYYGSPDQGFANVYVYQQQGNTVKNEGVQKTAAATTSNNNVVGGGGTGTGGGGGGYAPSAPALDQAKIDSLNNQFGLYDSAKNTALAMAAKKRDQFLNEKKNEYDTQNKTYQGKKLSTLQDFGGTVNDSKINVRDTLSNLLSSLSTLGLSGGRALQRQALSAADRSNRQADATQAQNNQALDNSWNEYDNGYKGDVSKIQDQYGADAAKANQDWATNRRDTLYKIGGVYNAANDTAKYNDFMKQGDSLNSVIANSAFVDPQYTGANRAMATPDLADYSQNVARFNTTGIGGATPVGGSMGGNMAAEPAVKAVVLNDKDLGVKQKQAGDLGYGV